MLRNELEREHIYRKAPKKNGQEITLFSAHLVELTVQV